MRWNFFGTMVLPAAGMAAFVAMTALTVAVLAEEPSAMPWRTNRPIATVKKEVFFKSPRPKACAYVNRDYVGPGLELTEVRSLEEKSDTLVELRCRLSRDNGRTWTDSWVIPDTEVRHAGVVFFEGSGPKVFDPSSGALVEIWLRQPAHDGRFDNFCYYRLSRDFGKTWTTPKQLRYEPGDEFDPEKPLAPGFLKNNQAYFGSNILRHRNGTLILAVAHANVPGDPENDRRAWRMGSLCFIGKWDAQANDYGWTAGRRVEISPEWSSRGLMEPELAELADGRVLVVWRGSNTATTPGHKWYSTSSDGGMTLAEVRELKYDDGTRFYSPSSFHRMLRHNVTGKLYWVGNICPEPPNGNSPRYPLVIAEVDETTPALRRGTVTVIDDRVPGDSPDVALSNFSLLENRETHAIEVYVSRLGANPKDFWGSDAYRCTLTFE
jgi:hypothetical protein